jgi:hypothetical protein
MLQCWYDHFLVEQYLREALTEEEWDVFLRTPSKPKLASLLESVEEAGKIKDGKSRNFSQNLVNEEDM